MALVDLDGGWRQVNHALCKMLHYSGEELLGARARSSRIPTTSPRPGAGQTADRGEIDHFEFEKRFLDSRGEIVWTPYPARSSVTTTAASRCTSSPRCRTSPSAASSRPSSPTSPTTTPSGASSTAGASSRSSTRQVAFTERYETGATLLMLDLDNFKYVNDTLGHAMGDELIVRVANALRRASARHRRDRAPGRRRVRDHPPGDRARRGRDPRRGPARDDRARRRGARQSERDPGVRQHRHRRDRTRPAAHPGRAHDERRCRDVRRQGSRPRALLGARPVRRPRGPPDRHRHVGRTHPQRARPPTASCCTSSRSSTSARTRSRATSCC